MRKFVLFLLNFTITFSSLATQALEYAPSGGAPTISKQSADLKKVGQTFSDSFISEVATQVDKSMANSKILLMLVVLFATMSIFDTIYNSGYKNLPQDFALLAIWVYVAAAIVYPSSVHYQSLGQRLFSIQDKVGQTVYNYEGGKSLDRDIFNQLKYQCDRIVVQLFEDGSESLEDKYMTTIAMTDLEVQSMYTAIETCAGKTGSEYQACTVSVMKSGFYKDADGKEADGSCSGLEPSCYIEKFKAYIYSVFQPIHIIAMLNIFLGWIRAAFFFFMIIAFGITAGAALILFKIVAPFIVWSRFRPKVITAFKVPLSAALYSSVFKIFLFLSTAIVASVHPALVSTFEQITFDYSSMSAIVFSIGIVMLIITAMQIVAVWKIPTISRQLLDLQLEALVSLSRDLVIGSFALIGTAASIASGGAGRIASSLPKGQGSSFGGAGSPGAGFTSGGETGGIPPFPPSGGSGNAGQFSTPNLGHSPGGLPTDIYGGGAKLQSSPQINGTHFSDVQSATPKQQGASFIKKGYFDRLDGAAQPAPLRDASNSDTLSSNVPEGTSTDDDFRDVVKENLSARSALEQPKEIVDNKPKEPQRFLKAGWDKMIDTSKQISNTSVAQAAVGGLAKVASTAPAKIAMATAKSAAGGAIRGIGAAKSNVGSFANAARGKGIGKELNLGAKAGVMARGALRAAPGVAMKLAGAAIKGAGRFAWTGLGAGFEVNDPNALLNVFDKAGGEIVAVGGHLNEHISKHYDAAVGEFHDASDVRGSADENGVKDRFEGREGREMIERARMASRLSGEERSLAKNEIRENIELVRKAEFNDWSSGRSQKVDFFKHLEKGTPAERELAKELKNEIKINNKKRLK